METTSQRKNLWQIGINMRLDDGTDNFRLLQKFKKGLVTVFISFFKKKERKKEIHWFGCTGS